MKDVIPLMPGESIFSLDRVGGDILFLCLTPFLYFLILSMIESDFITCGQKDQEIEGIEHDEDVLEEESRLDHSIPSDYQVRVKNLKKVYKDRGVKKVAVKELSFGVQYGE
jgi:hypothetical protein